jgi:glycosyltransferase involved in cell wall biosynthesis
MSAHTPTLKLLLSAYACEPDRGSEPGVGWRWALEVARLGHEVVVVTRENNRPAIERAMHGYPDLPNLRFAYYDLPHWARWWKRGSRGVHLYYVLWQFGAFLLARRLHRVEHFDAVQHITFGVTRHPSFMGRLGIPFVLGPLGGGERAPWALRKHFPLTGQLGDAARDLANHLARIDPFVRQSLAAASVILLKTSQSLLWLPERYRHKARTMIEIGIDMPAPDLSPAATGGKATRLLYVGRFLDWKGMGLGLRAVALLQRDDFPVKLTLLGQGPALGRWQALAEELGIAGNVRWISWLPQRELMATYRNYDALLFPSLHDSSGNVVLEAMARGLPVVCLELGGPAELVNSSCGWVVPVVGRREDTVVAALAAAIKELCGDDKELHRLRDGALARAREFQWTPLVARVWGPDGLGCAAVAEYAIQKGKLSYENSLPS